MSTFIWQNNKRGKKCRIGNPKKSSTDYLMLANIAKFAGTGNRPARMFCITIDFWLSFNSLRKKIFFPRIIFYYVLLSNLILLLWHRIFMPLLFCAHLSAFKIEIQFSWTWSWITLKVEYQTMLICIKLSLENIFR